MQVRSRAVSFAVGSELTRSQSSLTVEKLYDVHAVSVHEGTVRFLVIDDSADASFLPGVLFDIVDPRIPTDWICNTFRSGPVEMVMGPDFIANDLAAYDAIAERDWDRLDLLWRRIDAPPVRIYLAIAYRVDDARTPMLVYRELDAHRRELRKLELFTDGRFGWADGATSAGGTRLVEPPVPRLGELMRDEELDCDEIMRVELEQIWDEYTRPT